MEFTADRSVLKNALSILGSVPGKVSTMPVLSNILLRASDKKVLLAASDLATTVTHEIECEVKKEGGVTVAARQLQDVIGSLAQADVSLKREDNHFTTVRAGKSVLTIAGLSERDFPALPAAGKALGRIDRAKLLDLFDRGSYFVLKEDAPDPAFLAGMHFQCDGKKAMTLSSNRHCAVSVELDVDGGPDIPKTVIPYKGLQDLVRAVKESDGQEVELGLATVKESEKTARQLVVRCGKTLVCVRLIGVDYNMAVLDYIRRPDKYVCIAPREALTCALERINIVAQAERDPYVALALSDGNLRISAESQTGTGVEELPVQYDSDPYSFGISPRYFLEALRHIQDDEVWFSAADHWGAPVVVRGVEDKVHCAALSPMKLRTPGDVA